jgi:hypothetical protein
MFQKYILDQGGIIEILNQAKAWDPEWHEAMVNIKFDIFEISYEESVSYFESLEILEKIRCTNSSDYTTLSVDDKNVQTFSVV